MTIQPDLRHRIEAEIDRLIGLLDVVDGDPDLEPWLAGIGGPDDDREGDPLDDGELDDSDDEPSLGFLENHPYPTHGSLHFASRDQSGSQEGLCQGLLFDVEEQCDDEGDTSDSGIADEEGRMEQCPQLFQYSMRRVE